MLSKSLLWSSFLLALIPNTFAQSDSNVTNPTQRVTLALDALQSWYNPNTGLWETTGWWNGANVMTVIGNFANADPENNTLQTLARNVFATTLVKAPGKNPNPGIEDRGAEEKPSSTGWGHWGQGRWGKGNWGQGRWGAWGGEYKKYKDPNTGEPHTSYPTNWYTVSIAPAAVVNSSAPNASDWLDGYYDDDLWWALAWINAYDVTFNTPYLKLAEDIFLAVARTWGTYCFEGGIYWSHEKNYVNAIANELFFSTAAHLATRVEFQKQAVYREWAEKSLEWFLQTGMLNQKGTINDGLTKDCKNNGQTTWSYNQGVILGGLLELQKASPDPKNQYIALASHIANAALIELSDQQGVIHDECEPNCGADGTQFKGIFMRNLVELQGAGKDDFRKAINANADSIWKNDRGVLVNGLNVFSVDWAGPFVQPANASTQSSAMEALIGAVLVPCRNCSTV
ncbi:glycosyl hydrolase [Pyrenophora tritici-repentis]|uniref:Glycoside hydrolase family 76 protein n=1 Tax=Pyrenophora tritici-repentis TaxID=45151 RepID=A0A2W1ERD3_9PLEO|nr:Glycoside hydrolase family 76 protein [Pyrenophora tritici-repentis]KAF7450778.1 Glycoside hydrolase family 76 protein [Pyrenophora tritici-repentis]KAF7573429.1 glycosyl hydrolase [Pyrenophora tritici-repentis]KAG9381008.1 Glycoside hydrolase family 76 protein [Pyrenophora tritici-repentis]KAI1516264.1 Glycoside hydrolase family 76 protein [Pyrenophora tritici-repentis]